MLWRRGLGRRVSSDDLVATCQKREGGWRNTKLDDYQNCRSDITNDKRPSALRTIAV